MRPHIPSFAVCLIASALLVACTQRIAPPCPPQNKLIDHARITQFRDGPGRDITDIDFKAVMADPVGQCIYPDDEDRMIISLQVVFDIERGPTARTQTEDVPYYVAIVTKDQKIIRKESFLAQLTYPERASRMRFIDGFVDIEIPLSENLRPNMIEVKTGFQLTEEQLQYNRASIAR
ncbi:hypothetical protein GH722_07310 [Alphaproteobacteria bacterium HT1-32]|nr:hypothetical protein [Alphaproteobacteria bacterium HT1-32]